MEYTNIFKWTLLICYWICIGVFASGLIISNKDKIIGYSLAGLALCGIFIFNIITTIGLPATLLVDIFNH